MEAPENRLRQCLCGEKSSRLIFDHYEDKGWRWHCLACGRRGDWGVDGPSAAEGWNAALSREELL
jgi:hypothetical protein